MNMDKITDGQLTIVVAGPVGFGNNIYVVIDRETGEAAFIDAPGDAAANAEAAGFGGVRPSKILLTHSHGDHTSAIDGLK
ncbi:MAG: MBL fold metallo-hydrolase [Dehalococcoidia bacterium]|nr:MBL fold metallo-hydrolase [Dehalococcoidia bacterium]